MTATKVKPKTIQCVVTTADFLAGLNLCAGVAGSRTKPILACCKLSKNGNELRVEATDLSTWASYSTAQVQMDEWPDVAAPCAELRAIVAGMGDDTIQLSIEGEHLRITSTRADFKLYTQKAEDFPPRPEMESDAVKVTIGAAELARMIRQTKWAIADTNSRYAWAGICFESSKKGLTAAATESHVLAVTSIACKADAARVVAPEKLVLLAEKILEGSDDDATIYLHANRVCLELDGVEIYSTAPEGTFPPYEDTIPKDTTTTIKIDREDLRAAISHASIVLTTIAAQGGDGLRFSFTDKALKISGASPGKGECGISLPIISDSGKPIEIGLNPKYLSGLLQAAECEIIELMLTAPNRPLMARDGKATFICMPMNLH